MSLKKKYKIDKESTVCWVPRLTEMLHAKPPPLISASFNYEPPHPPRNVACCGLAFLILQCMQLWSTVWRTTAAAKAHPALLYRKLPLRHVTLSSWLLTNRVHQGLPSMTNASYIPDVWTSIYPEQSWNYFFSRLLNRLFVDLTADESVRRGYPCNTYI